MGKISSNISLNLYFFLYSSVILLLDFKLKFNILYKTDYK